jgi:NAD(P)-dependent dehydrogenase (short-subunit alcohol dehydrogenase family)
MADKVLAITGGASGIGLAIAEAALAEGWRVAVADRDEAALERACGALDPARTAFAPLDVTEEASVESWIAGLAPSGRLAGAVAAAGIGADVPALDTPAELFRRILEVNVTGSFLFARAAARAMRDAGEGGAILLIASVSGLRGSKGRAAYGASKAAVINLAQVMAVEGAAHGIRVNALCPGPVETPLVARIHTPETRAEWLRQLPMRRYGTPDEMAPTALFLLDGRKSGYLTGQAVSVDGGYAAAGLMPPAD